MHTKDVIFQINVHIANNEKRSPQKWIQKVVLNKPVMTSLFLNNQSCFSRKSKEIFHHPRDTSWNLRASHLFFF